MTFLSSFIHHAYFCFIEWDKAECFQKKVFTMRKSCPFYLIVALWDYERIQFSTATCRKTSGDFSVIHWKWGQRSGKIHMTFQCSSGKGQRCLRTGQRRLCRWASLSLLPSVPPSVRAIAWPPGIRQHAAHPSALILKLRKLGEADGRTKALEKTTEGKVNSRVGGEASGVSLVSFRLTASQSSAAVQGDKNQQLLTLVLCWGRGNNHLRPSLKEERRGLGHCKKNLTLILEFSPLCNLRKSELTVAKLAPILFCFVLQQQFSKKLNMIQSLLFRCGISCIHEHSEADTVNTLIDCGLFIDLD